jgi:hypothetical protein
MKFDGPVKIGLVGLTMLVIGSVWIWVMWSQTAVPGMKSSHFSLGQGETANLMTDLTGANVAFYKISIDDFDKSVLFVTVLDPNGNEMYQKQISTKVSVNYVDFGVDGKYMVTLKNVDVKDVSFTAEYGTYGSPESLGSMMPGFIAAIGIAMVLFFFYTRLSGHIIAHVV